MMSEVHDNKAGVMQRHKFYFNILNVCACFCVVLMHVNGAVWDFSYKRVWITSWFIETLAYWAVPVFFMLTGATLMNYRSRYDTLRFFKKRFKKTFIPFLFWSVLSVFWSVYWPGFLPPDTKITIRSMIDMIFNCKGLDIYWFFPVLFSIYLCIPVLSIIFQYGSKKLKIYFILYGVLTVSFIPFLCGLLGITFNSAFISPLFGGSLLYAALGYVISETEIKKSHRIIIYILGLVGWMLRFFGGIILSYKAGQVSSFFSGILNVPCLLFSCAVFVAAKYHDYSEWNVKICNMVNALSVLGFGIYLIHFYIIRYLVDTYNINMHSSIWRSGGTIVVYLSSALLVYLLRKIKIIRYVMP